MLSFLVVPSSIATSSFTFPPRKERRGQCLSFMLPTFHLNKAISGLGEVRYCILLRLHSYSYLTSQILKISLVWYGCLRCLAIQRIPKKYYLLSVVHLELSHWGGLRPEYRIGFAVTVIILGPKTHFYTICKPLFVNQPLLESGQ